MFATAPFSNSIRALAASTLSDMIGIPTAAVCNCHAEELRGEIFGTVQCQPKLVFEVRELQRPTTSCSRRNSDLWSRDRHGNGVRRPVVRGQAGQQGRKGQDKSGGPIHGA